MKKISVIMPVYNDKGFLRAMLDVYKRQIEVPAQYNMGNVYVKKSEINEIAKYKAGDWKENVMEYNEKIKRDNINCFRKIIDYCYKKEFVPVVVSLPVTNQLTQEMGKGFIREFEQCNSCLLYTSSSGKAQ